MIDEQAIYWITRLDSLKELCGVLAGLSVGLTRVAKLTRRKKEKP